MSVTHQVDDLETNGASGSEQEQEGGLQTTNYARSLGEKLRNIRTQKGMSLQDVQLASEGRWKAAVVGAYERGDRNVTVSRLADLADFYGVPVSEILPDDAATGTAVAPEVRRRVILDLEGLERVPEGDRDPLSRFTTAIQIQRGDYNGRVLTIREDDLMSLSLLYQTTSTELARRLETWGMIYSGAEAQAK
ncbi:MAG TPA: transcriptional regulator [Actinomycetota bacterium]|nr:transcriptional regulator [Actinomycetota bacterium]